MTSKQVFQRWNNLEITNWNELNWLPVIVFFGLANLILKLNDYFRKTILNLSKVSWTNNVVVLLQKGTPAFPKKCHYDKTSACEPTSLLRGPKCSAVEVRAARFWPFHDMIINKTHLTLIFKLSDCDWMKKNKKRSSKWKFLYGKVA